jgi:hypothetical protein
MWARLGSRKLPIAQSKGYKPMPNIHAGQEIEKAIAEYRDLVEDQVSHMLAVGSCSHIHDFHFVIEYAYRIAGLYEALGYVYPDQPGQPGAMKLKYERLARDYERQMVERYATPVGRRDR